MKIKWPNDIVVSGKKICGILTELFAETDGVNYVILGIGINVNIKEFSGELKCKATSVFIETGTGYNLSLIHILKVINITQDIQADETLEVNRSVIIKGKDGVKTINFENKDGIELTNAGEVSLEDIKIEITGDEEGWQGIYALQVYANTKAVLNKDVYKRL